MHELVNGIQRENTLYHSVWLAGACLMRDVNVTATSQPLQISIPIKSKFIVYIVFIFWLLRIFSISHFLSLVDCRARLCNVDNDFSMTLTRTFRRCGLSVREWREICLTIEYIIHISVMSRMGSKTFLI